MTAYSDIRRPYQVYFKAPALGTYPDPAPYTTTAFVDTGLTQDDVDELVHPETVRRLELMNLLARGSTVIFCLWFGLAVYGVAALLFGFAHPLLAVPAVTAAIAFAVFVARSKGQAKEAGDSLQKLHQSLIAAGRLSGVDRISNGTAADFRRIHQALIVLQGQHGGSFDDAARAAVIAVLNRDAQEPSWRQREIADSPATDENTNAIRSIVAAKTTKWLSDVALAEHLILQLEDAAATGGKESATD